MMEPTFLLEMLNFCKRYPSIPLLTGFGSVYLTYYLLSAVKKPVLVSGGGKFETFLIKHCPVIKEHFWPTIWCLESRCQTIFRALFFTKGPKVNICDSELVKTPDGGQFRLDWVTSDNSTKYPDPKSRPTVIILPGLTGHGRQPHIRHYLHEVLDLGYRGVVFNNRGCAGVELLTPRTYNACNPDDLRTVVKHIRSKYQESPIIAVGFSLGGMILFNYIAKLGKDCDLVAGFAVSPPWDVFESSISLRSRINQILFNRPLAKALCNKVHKFRPLLEESYDIQHIMKSDTIRDFDDRLTCKMFGYSGWEDYYNDATLHDKAHLITVPVLTLNAEDDVFSPLGDNVFKHIKASKNCAILVTPRGGHIGFLDGVLFPAYRTYMNRVFVEFVQAIFEHREELTEAETLGESKGMAVSSAVQQKCAS